MSGNNQPHDERFPILEDARRHEAAHDIAVITLQMSQLVEDFSAIDRIPRFSDGRRENDVEHTFMLGMAAPLIAEALDLDLFDVHKVRRFVNVHDLLELKIGEIATFDMTAEEQAEKERLTREAKAELLAELPPPLAKDLEEYERQDTPEAIFVRMVDKLLPIAVDITGEGVRIMREDYNVKDFEALQAGHAKLHARVAEAFGADFPDLVAAHAIMCQMFEATWLETASKVKAAEKTRNPTEVERKFLIDLGALPAEIDLSTVPRKHLRQGYIAIGTDGSETRVRSTDGEKFELTRKSGGMIARDEKTIPLTTEEEFDTLWHSTSGRCVEKTRYLIPWDGYTIELDVYESRHLQGLVTAEVEFDGRPEEAMLRAKTFKPPEWFGRDISEDSRYKNRSLAQQRPHDPIPLGSKPL